MLFSDPIIKTGLLAVLEPQFNAVLQLDPVTLDRLTHYFGCVVEFHCLEPDFRCYAYILEHQVRLAGSFDGVPDVCFEGSVISFSQLAGDRKASFENIQGLTVSGNEVLINALACIHQDMEPDWEKPIVDVLGIVSGHWLAQGVRFVRQQLDDVKQTIEQNCAEYLQEELKLVPARAEIDGFSADVEKLQQSTDQLAEKIQLKNLLNNNDPSEH